jgi:putative sigma-54 modulation protein
MAQIVVKGKNIEVSEPLRDYVEKKLGKLESHMDKITTIAVELSAEQHKTTNSRQVVQVTMQVNGQIIRAEEASSDMYAAVDVVLEKLRRSLERYKSKLYRKDDIRKNRREKARMLEASAAAEAEAGEETGISRVKRFQIKPMSPDEAAEQMELLGHDFYLFYDQEAAAVSLVYKRKNGSYGLLIPELA